MNQGNHEKFDPQRLAVAQLARVLTAAGGRKVTAAEINQDLADGAPRNPDGSIHVVHFTAWLVSQTRTEAG